MSRVEEHGEEYPVIRVEGVTKMVPRACGEVIEE